VRVERGAIEGLKMLANYGVDLCIIMHDGRTLLHMAAELAIEPGVISFLIDSGCRQYIDKQDHWGWTPLHYAIIAEFYGRYPYPFEKMASLLIEGARTDLKGWHMPYVSPTRIPDTFTAIELSANLKPSILNEFIQVLRKNGRDIPPEFDERPFEDAMEHVNTQPMEGLRALWSQSHDQIDHES
jgi:Ankyrin repeats (3 copies)